MQLQFENYNVAERRLGILSEVRIAAEIFHFTVSRVCRYKNLQVNPNYGELSICQEKLYRNKTLFPVAGQTLL